MRTIEEINSDIQTLASKLSELKTGITSVTEYEVMNSKRFEFEKLQLEKQVLFEERDIVLNAEV